MKKLPSKLKDNFEVNFDDTINSGQVFLWEKINSKWYGVNGKSIMTLNDKPDTKNKKQSYSFHTTKVCNNFLKKFEIRTERSTKNKPTQLSGFLFSQ